MFPAPRRLLAVLLPALLAACATVPPGQRDPRDPWESWNRAVFRFNTELDKALVKPVVRTYQRITPDVVESAITNFFANLRDVGIFCNDLLQGKLADAGVDAGRLIMNTTLGLGGLFDIATEAGLTKHDEDFGQTLGRWGVPPGPYLMLPVLGPSTLRDTAALLVDYPLDPITRIEDDQARLAFRSLDLIDARSRALKVEEVFGGGFYDPYEVLRNAYLKRREVLVHDGAEQAESGPDEEMIRELEELEAPEDDAAPETAPAAP